MNLISVVFLLVASAHAAEEGMREMPKIVPKRSFVVETREQGNEMLENRGFGAQEPSVRMKNLMMVGGSGYEGMDMSAPPPGYLPHSPPASAPGVSWETMPAPLAVGKGTISISLRDGKGAPRSGLNLIAEVSMVSMNMGTQKPRVRETLPGRYELSASFPMRGRWSVKLLLPEGEKSFTVDVP